MADGAYREIKKALDRIEGKTDNQTVKLTEHGERLVRIETKQDATNGKVSKSCEDINQLYKLNNERENFQERLIGSFASLKYLVILLGAIATLISIYSFITP